ncbi:hypothetical protein H074_11517 [Amycolatopsis decaplanina DSM 44594]|uniref:Uncharacterized protein n=1 Tax=Amycolatopsis decaplanina DSM 44594 TaxID=1284240 RepID=M2ZIK7_9PSEU|nr:hypothetical protein H074_11517 [Amycolatopsis decaplanina DSM 44594]
MVDVVGFGEAEEVAGEGAVEGVGLVLEGGVLLVDGGGVTLETGGACSASAALAASTSGEPAVVSHIDAGSAVATAAAIPAGSFHCGALFLRCLPAISLITHHFGDGNSRRGPRAPGNITKRTRQCHA